MTTNPTSATQDFDHPYAVTSALEIISVLKNIQMRQALLQLRIQPGTGSIVTTLLNVDNEGNALIFDSAPTEQLTQRITAAGRLNFEASVDSVHVSFQTGPAVACTHEDAPALRVPFPSQLIRVQRRDYFRIATPVSRPVMCTIKVDDKPHSLPLDDISVGGISIFDDGAALDHTIGVVYEDCTVLLPDIGTITVTLRVAHYKEITLPNGRVRYRLGCSFESPNGATVNLVQRYVTQLQREEIARRRGFA